MTAANATPDLRRFLLLENAPSQLVVVRPQRG
jgi:hypothetical protein